MKPTIYDLYQGPLCLWVEDALTQDVLTALWQDTQISVLIAHGKEGVLHMVGARPARVRGKVFGLVDRDFDDDNEPRWEQPDCEILRLPAHELENLLLDFEVLSALSGAEAPGEIEQRARRRAEELLFWMAVKGVLRTMQRSLGAGFPADPPASIDSQAAAAQFLARSAYWASHGREWKRWNDEAERTAALLQEVQRLRGDLSTDAWLRTFSGKEIFRCLRADVPKLDTTPKRPPNPTSADRDLNLAKRIAAKMRELNLLPAPLNKLRRVLRSKANLQELQAR